MGLIGCFFYIFQLPVPTTSTPATTTSTTTTSTSTSTTTPKTTTTSTTTPPATTTPETTTVPTTTSTKKAETGDRHKRDVKQLNGTGDWNLEALIKEGVVNAADIANRKNLKEANAVKKVIPIADKLKNIEHPFVCSNKSMVAADPKKTYGYFKKEFVVQSEFLSLYLYKSLASLLNLIYFF